MIIDARKAEDPKNGRPFTVSTAVADAIDKFRVGSKVSMEKALDAMGGDVPVERVRMLISKHKGARSFTTRVAPDGSLIIWRIA